MLPGSIALQVKDLFWKAMNRAVSFRVRDEHSHRIFDVICGFRVTGEFEHDGGGLCGANPVCFSLESHGVEPRFAGARFRGG